MTKIMDVVVTAEQWDTLIAEVHALSVDMIALRNEVARVVAFIAMMEQVVSQMSDNPMLKMMGMSGLSSGFAMPEIPGLSKR